MVFNATTWATIVNVLIAVVTIAGLSWTFSRQKTKDLSDLQTKIIQTQKDALAAQDQHITQLIGQVTRLTRVIATTQAILKRRGVTVVVEGDYVTVRMPDPNARDTGSEISAPIDPNDPNASDPNVATMRIQQQQRQQP